MTHNHHAPHDEAPKVCPVCGDSLKRAGEFDPADLKTCGCFDVVRFFERLRAKHGILMTTNPKRDQ